MPPISGQPISQHTNLGLSRREAGVLLEDSSPGVKVAGAGGKEREATSVRERQSSPFRSLSFESDARAVGQFFAAAERSGVGIVSRRFRG